MINKIFVSLLLSLLILPGMFFGFAEKANAAAAICYSVGETGEGNYARVVTCNTGGGIYQRIVRQQHAGTTNEGQGMLNDHCYELSAGTQVLEYPISSSDCQRLANEAANSDSQSAKCFVIQNDKSVSVYDSLSLKLREVSEKPCSQEALASLVPNPENGMCYIFNKDKTEYREDGCLTMLGNLVAGAANADIQAQRDIADECAQGDTDCINRGEGFTETDCGDIRNNPNKCNIIKLANSVVKFLSAVVGVVVTAMIISAGVRYISAGSDPQAVSKAKTMIRNAVIAIVCYIFLLSFLNWVIPGGIV